MGRKVAGWAFSCCRTPTFIGPLFVFNLEIVTQKIYNIDIIDINNYISILSQNSKTFTYGSAMHMRLLPWLWTSSANRRTLYGGRYSYKSSNLFEPIMCNVWIRNLINTNRHFVLINLYDSKQFIYHHHSRTKPTIVWQKCKRLPLTQNEKKSAFRQRFCLDLFSVLHSDLYIHWSRSKRRSSRPLNQEVFAQLRQCVNSKAYGMYICKCAFGPFVMHAFVRSCTGWLAADRQLS